MDPQRGCVLIRFSPVPVIVKLLVPGMTLMRL